VHSVHKRSKLWITYLSTVSSVERRGFEPSGIFFYLSFAPDCPMSLATWWCSARKLVAKTR
jgi:hypothetical protein